jgi:hypothetical protein
MSRFIKTLLPSMRVDTSAMIVCLALDPGGRGSSVGAWQTQKPWRAIRAAHHGMSKS